MLVISGLQAQNTFEFGLLPAININKKWEGGWHLNVKVESRQLLNQGVIKEDNRFDYDYELTDVATIVSKKIAYNQNLGGGYLIRLRGEDWFHRTIQQFSITNQFSGFRLGHRFSADQTFGEIATPEFRFRYRITLEKSLSGQNVDDKEFYFKLNNEYLLGIESSNAEIELRFVPILGYEIDANNKIEVGLDYRIAPLFEENNNQRYFVTMSWFTSL